MKLKLLIVTTFYNEKERLEFTLTNMLQQRNSDFVHLLIDDGSTKNASDEIVQNYISQSKHPVIFEKHENAGINEVHMRAFGRTIEFGCSHFMWLDCGDGLQDNAVDVINSIILENPEIWLHLDGYYISEKNDEKVRMSSRSYMPYLKKKDQFLPFCFSVSTYGHFIIPFKVYSRYNPDFIMTEGFYYDAQIVGALSLNNCKHRFVQEPLSIIQDDQHFSVTNSAGNSYRDNLLRLSDFVVGDPQKKQAIADISIGIPKISIRQLFSSRKYNEIRSRVKELKRFYAKNDIKTRDRYKWLTLAFISLFFLC